VRFVVLSTSRGTTFQAVIDAMQAGALTATCLALVTDKRERGCTAKAEAAGIPVVTVARIQGEEREAYDRRLDAAIRALGQVDVIAALGWMWILTPWFVSQWHGRILNVHPALLPKFPGAHGIEDALAAGATETGMTIHIIDEGVDTGPILVQKKCSIEPGETVDSLKAKVQELEKKWYPATLQMLEAGELKLPK
jgi:phosphoribosylglycinamide formyltransferase-1